jgi:formate dehydrogenase iron-sulfur subunit
VYLAVRLGDMIIRGQFGAAFTGNLSVFFAVEIIFGGILPLLLLARNSLRTNPKWLFLGALLTTLGIVFNRVNVVLLGMHLKGPMPQVAPQSYFPSVFEWGISVGLIAAAIFLFGLGVRLLPVLPKQHPVQGD